MLVVDMLEGFEEGKTSNDLKLVKEVEQVNGTSVDSPKKEIGVFWSDLPK